jgi:hypothetical protein
MSFRCVEDASILEKDEENKLILYFVFCILYFVFCILFKKKVGIKHCKIINK